MMMMTPRVLKRSRPYSSKVDTKLLNLPRDILIDIILRLPLKSVCSIQCASKMLLNIVDKEFVAQYTRRQDASLPNGRQVPQLVLLTRSYDGNNEETKIVHPWPLQFSDAVNIEEVCSKIIVSQEYTYEVHCVFSNLICFKDVSYGGPSFLFDPLKRQVLGLPASDEAPTLAYIRCGRRELFDWLAMGYDDTTGKLKIVRVSGNSRYKNLVAQVLELGTSSWRVIPAFPPCNLSHKNASAYGDVHWLIATEPRTRGESDIISFDFKKEEFSWTHHPTLRSGEQRSTCDLNLVNLRGSLAIVDVLDEFIVDIWVLKNYKEKHWVLEYSIELPSRISIRLVMGHCGEWEHGIFLKDAISTGTRNGAYALFLDLRDEPDRAQVELVDYPVMLNWTIISYTGSLIYLRHYGDLVEAEACDTNPETAWFL